MENTSYKDLFRGKRFRKLRWGVWKDKKEDVKRIVTDHFSSIFETCNPTNFKLILKEAESSQI